MNNSFDKKQKVLLILGVLILIVSISGIAFAFFNYTRTGENNTLRLGSIEFSSNYTSVTLQNIFPVDSNDIGNDTDNVATVTINVNGKTTYSGGVEYLVSLVDVDNVGGNSVIPISLNVSVSSGLGTSDNSYFTNRGSTTKFYKVLADTTVYNGEYVVVGYIPNSDVTTSGTITLKAYIDADSIAISDTYDGSESYEMGTTSNWVDGRTIITTNAWNSAISEGLSFKIKVEANEGTWVNEPENFYDLIEGKATSAPTYVKSYTTSVINNGNSTFTTQDTVGTNNNKQEVYYYTGSDAITNGNVLFAGYCWQIVRTTDNGGVRLIYNGIAENNQCTDSRSSNTYLGVKAAAENIALASAYFPSAYLYGDSYDYDLVTGKFHLVNSESSTRTWSLATYESFMGKYTCKNATGTNCDNVWYVGQYAYNNNAQVEATKYSIGNIDNYREMGSSNFNAGYSSAANIGYMYNKIYNPKNEQPIGAIYGRDVEYNNGEYLVIDSTPGQASGSSNTSLIASRHYTCGLDGNSNPITTCATVRYYFYTGYYIKLTGGETVEDVLKNMINYKQVGDNVDANINVISSSIKDYLEIWYDKNLKAYEGYLDTNAVYCNNRTVTGLGGWSKSGRVNSTISFKQTIDNLDLACENEADRFSKENGKAQIKNPIGLITEPERGLMGSTYAATGSVYWGFSPYYFEFTTGGVRSVDASGATTFKLVNVVYGVRGAITLAPGTVILGGTGDDEDPYQVGPLVTR